MTEQQRRGWNPVGVAVALATLVTAGFAVREATPAPAPLPPRPVKEVRHRDIVGVHYMRYAGSREWNYLLEFRKDHTYRCILRGTEGTRVGYVGIWETKGPGKILLLEQHTTPDELTDWGHGTLWLRWDGCRLKGASNGASWGGAFELLPRPDGAD